MSSTNYTNGTVVQPAWLNDVNTVTYNAASGITNGVIRTQIARNADTYNIMDAGAVGDGVADDTAALQLAITSIIKAGGFGTINVPSGKTFKITSAVTTDGVLGLTIKGGNGGNVGNLSAGSTGGASVFNFTNTTGDSFNFTGVAYHAAQIVFEDIAFYSNTTGTAITFNNFSQINFNRVTVTNAGGTTNVTGNLVKFSNCYYVYAQNSYFWKTGTLFTVGVGVVIDKGALSSFLGGLYNFTNCSFYGCSTGFKAGGATAGSSANDNYASINLDGCEFNSNSQGAEILYGVKSFSAVGCYVEGNLSVGFSIANQPRNVNIKRNFFNNFSASSADIVLGLNGSGTSYTQYYDVDISYNQFLSVKFYGILTAASGVGSSFNAEGNSFYLGTAGAIGINSGQAASGNLRATTRNNNFYGFPVGTAMAGFFTSQDNNNEFNAAGTFIGSWNQAEIDYPAFTTFTQIMPNDPKFTTITNTTVGARYINATPSASRGREQTVILKAASTQNVGLYKSDTATLMVTLTPGKIAKMWNDGVNEYASLLP